MPISRRCREKIEKAGPVLEANSQGSALARLFGLPDTKAATLSTYQNLAMAVVIEFLIAISLVASEVIGQPERVPAPRLRLARKRTPEGRGGESRGSPADRSITLRKCAQALAGGVQAPSNYLAGETGQCRANYG